MYIYIHTLYIYIYIYIYHLSTYLSLYILYWQLRTWIESTGWQRKNRTEPVNHRNHFVKDNKQIFSNSFCWWPFCKKSFLENCGRNICGRFDF